MVNKKIIAISIIVLSGICKLFYIFHCTNYQNSLYADMGYYWYGAFERFSGDRFSSGQYAIFAPAYIYSLSLLFQLLNFFNFIQHALDVVIILNVLCFCFSSYVVYLLLDRFIIRKILVLLGLIVYSFSYTTTYFNALVLADNLAIPLIVISTGILILFKDKTWCLLTAGFLLGLGIALKPSLILFSIVFVFYLFKAKKRWVIIFLFCLSLILAPTWTLIENYHVSGGKLKSFAAYGGVNFFQGWQWIKTVRSFLPTTNWWVDFPNADQEFTFEAFITNEPFYNQAYFYKMGINAILNHPERLWTKMYQFRKLFFGFLAPIIASHPPAGFAYLIQISQYMLYIMFLSLWVLPLYFLKHTHRKEISLLCSLIIVFLLTFYLLGTPDRRYLYFIEFLIIINFFVALDKIFSLFRIYRRELLLYFLSLAGLHVYVWWILSCCLVKR